MQPCLRDSLRSALAILGVPLHEIEIIGTPPLLSIVQTLPR